MFICPACSKLARLHLLSECHCDECVDHAVQYIRQDCARSAADTLELTIDVLKEEVGLLARDRARAIDALRSIAAFDDKGACEDLEKTGSYGTFDEPGSVRMAREALGAHGIHV